MTGTYQHRRDKKVTRCTTRLKGWFSQARCDRPSCEGALSIAASEMRWARSAVADHTATRVTSRSCSAQLRADGSLWPAMPSAAGHDACIVAGCTAGQEVPAPLARLFLRSTRPLLVELALHLVAHPLALCFVDGQRSRLGGAFPRMCREPLLVSGLPVYEPSKNAQCTLVFSL